MCSKAQPTAISASRILARPDAHGLWLNFSGDLLGTVAVESVQVTHADGSKAAVVDKRLTQVDGHELANLNRTVWRTNCAWKILANSPIHNEVNQHLSP